LSALAGSDDKLSRALFRTDVDDVRLRQLTLATAGRHVVDVTAVGGRAAVAAEDAGQLSGLSIARVTASACTATPARHDTAAPLRCRSAVE